jgi:two-component system, LytTR family, sensor kinase
MRQSNRRRLNIALLAGLYTAIGLLLFGSGFFDDLAHQHYGTGPARFIEEMTGAYTAFAVLPLIIWIVHWLERRKFVWPVSALILLAGAGVFTAAHTTLMALTRAAIFPLAGLGRYDYGIMLYRYPMEGLKDVIVFSVTAAIVYFFDRLALARKTELEAAELQTKLAQAHLENLRLQLHPHFLFNTLNAISSVMYEDVEKADLMLAKLSDFLRRVLASSGVHQVSLDEELDVERMYVDIMTTRLERRLTLDVRVDPAASHAIVPFMILQPLIENSIRHGRAGEHEAIGITVDVARQNGSTVVRVIDDGSGLQSGGDAMHRGHGLSNVAGRLHTMFGDESAFAIGPHEAGGTEVTLRFPYATATEMLP